MPSGNLTISKPQAPAAGATSSAGLECRQISIKQLDDQLTRQWLQLQRSNPRLQSGYFHPEFARAVAAVRGDVRIGLFYRADHLLAIFPFQRVASREAHPIGGKMNDFHGLITQPSTIINPYDLLKLLDLRRVKLHAAIEDTGDIQSHVIKQMKSPFIDISAGFDAYWEFARNHSTTIRRQGQKTRKLQREFGPIRLEFNCPDPQVLETLILWKRQKFRRTKTFDILSVDWTANLLRRIFEMQQAGFEGRLAGLWSGDHLVAGHFGFECNGILQYWFPAFNHRFAKYSPGTQLLLSIIQQCPERNIHRIDLSYGDMPFKYRFANDYTTVAFVDLWQDSWGRNLSRIRHFAERSAKSFPGRPLVKSILRRLHPGFGQRQFR